MKLLVDVVNFNADASCLDSARWLDALQGGATSQFCRWLGIYVRLEKKVVLGLTGATLADLHAHNPEALDILRRHPETFEGIVRPFSHDIALLRHRDGFALNLRLGMLALRSGFTRSSDYYLPPEFMLSNEQTAILARSGILGTFVNPERLAADIRSRIPDRPYWMRGLENSRLRCLPIACGFTQAYLDSLHTFTATPWLHQLGQVGTQTCLSWRDGESSFLLPDGLARELAWLEGEAGCERQFLSGLAEDFRANTDLAPEHLRSYPVHSFLAWMKEFRMMGYLGRLQRLESEVSALGPEGLALWLQAVNSDVMSAVEKVSPQIRIRAEPDAKGDIHYTILRSERGFEGEECLSMLERMLQGDSRLFGQYIGGDEPPMRKLRGRFEYLKHLLEQAV